MNNLAKISGGRAALKQAIDYKMHLLRSGYSGVDFCLDSGDDIFLIAYKDGTKLSYTNDAARQRGGLNLFAFENFTARKLGELFSEFKIARYIDWVTTDNAKPSYRGLGVGKLLVSRAINRLKNKHSVIAPIFLDALPEYSDYFGQFGFEDYDKSNHPNPSYKKCLEQTNCNANKILTRDRFCLAQTKSFFADGHQIFAPKLAAKR